MKTVYNKFVRLSKKLVLLDYIFIGIFISIVFAFVIFFKRNVVFIPVTFQTNNERPLVTDLTSGSDYSQNFIVGDTEKNEFGQTTATITHVNSYFTDSANETVFVTVNVKAVYSPRKKQYVVKSRPIAFGSVIPFIFQHVTFNGMVVKFPDLESAQHAQRGITRVKAQLRNDSRSFSEISGVPMYLAYAIKPDDVIKNANNETMATIVSVDIKPAVRMVVTSSGIAINTVDPNLFDVFYIIDLNTKVVNNNTYMFDYFPVLLGKRIPINLPAVSVYPTIVEIFKTE